MNNTNHERLSADRQLLVGLNKRLQVVRDRATGVAKRYQSGVIFTGRGGTGKSWTVEETLEQLGVPQVLHNSHLTPRGLFDAP